MAVGELLSSSLKPSMPPLPGQHVAASHRWTAPRLALLANAGEDGVPAK